MSANEYDLALILCTVGRKGELSNLFDCFNGDIANAEIIIVDQNESPAFVKSILYKLTSFKKVTYVNASKVSLSAARNLGLSYIKSKYVCFPDDDCLYVDNLLASLLEQIDTGLGCYTGVCFKYPGMKIMNRETIDYKNLLGRVISFSFFIESELATKIKFDESLGVGNFYGACEESVFLLECLGTNAKIKYIDDFSVYHPLNDSLNFTREFNYGKGFGFLSLYYAKHFGFFGVYKCLYLLLTPLIRVSESLFKLKITRAIRYSVIFFSRIFGFFIASTGYKPKNPKILAKSVEIYRCV